MSSSLAHWRVVETVAAWQYNSWDFDYAAYFYMLSSDQKLTAIALKNVGLMYEISMPSNFSNDQIRAKMDEAHKAMESLHQHMRVFHKYPGWIEDGIRYIPFTYQLAPLREVMRLSGKFTHI